MQQNLNPATQVEALRKAMVELQDVPRRVQVRTLMPMVDVAIKQGFGIAYLAQILGEGGVPFKPSSLKQAVYLWRKKKGMKHNVRPAPNWANEPAFQLGYRADAKPELSHNMGESASIELGDRQSLTKADLVSIRESHVDLDEIVRMARKQNSNSYVQKEGLAD
ncbi:MAG TPA: hypothetical protein DIS96_13015 [Pusillimonas sp.]|nr:hypothetical protein [Pusillimonas sp.]